MVSMDLLLKAVDAAKGDLTEAEICKAAGLPLHTIRQLRRGVEPSLWRAAAIADAVGLKLWLGRKGESINPYALELAVVDVINNIPDAEGRKAAINAFGAHADNLAVVYEVYHHLFPIDTIDTWAQIFNAASVALEKAGIEHAGSTHLRPRPPIAEDPGV